jgi:hypothetical protein
MLVFDWLCFGDVWGIVRKLREKWDQPEQNERDSLQILPLIHRQVK